jgi:deoxyribose-phosphate aldolase
MTAPRLHVPRPVPAADRSTPSPIDPAAWSAGDPDQPPARNPGMPLDLDLVLRTRVNRSAAERRVATLPARRTVKKEWQAA